MAKLDLNVADFQNIEQPVSEILPAGEYVMQIIKSERRDTKAGTGWYLQLEFDVLSGPCPPGRKFWDRLNLKNVNEQAQQIAQRQFHALYTAMGYDFPPDDSDELHFKPVRVVIKHKENKQGGLDAQAKYLPAGGTAPQRVAAAAPAPAAAPTGAAPKPWERHKK
jgi:hypothetical protein